MQRVIWIMILIAILLVITIAVLIWYSGILQPEEPTPTPTPSPPPVDTATPVPTVMDTPTAPIPDKTPTEGPAPTETPLPGTGLGGDLPGFPPGFPVPPGIPSRQSDWRNPCYTIEMPESAPLGSSDGMGWETCTIERIEEYLAQASACMVTMPTGETIPKPAILSFNIVYTIGFPEWEHWWYDHTPQWVYADIERRTGQTLPRVGGRMVGYFLDTDGDGPDPGVACPMYDNPIWLEHMRESLRQIGKVFGDDPRLTALMIPTGIDGEVMGTKNATRTGINGTGQMSLAEGSIMVDSSKSWRPNDWQGWTLWVDSGPQRGLSLKVVSNTKDTITLEKLWPKPPQTGDRYRLTKYCNYTGVFGQYVSAGGYNQYIRSMIDWYRKFFPRKPVYLMSSWQRDDLADYCARKWPPVGTKINAMMPDHGAHYSLTKEGNPGTRGVWLMLHNLYGIAPIAMESGPAHWEFGEYWSFLMALSVHSDWTDTYNTWLDNKIVTSGFLADHLGVTIGNTPSVWIALRDTDHPPSPGNAGGKPGDWEFWLYRPEVVSPYNCGNERREDIPNNKTVIVDQRDLPGGTLPLEHIPAESWKARRTDEASGNRFMSFDIDDHYPFAGRVPFDAPGGEVGYDITITLVNHVAGGRDTVSLQYLNYQGELRTHSISKGTNLGALDQWVKYTWRVTDAYMNNGMPGSTDFRISCNGDGNETIHMLQVKGFWGIEPPTPMPTNTFLPSPTPGPATATPTPREGTPGPPPPTTTPRPSPTMSPLVLDFYPGSVPVTVDGSLNEWSGDRLITLDVNTAYLATGIIDDRSDLSADVWAAWDQDYLYFGVHVNDDILVADSSGTLWHDDTLEIGLDGLYDHVGWQGDDHQYAIRFDGMLTDMGKLLDDPNLLLGTQRVAGGYDIEFGVPMQYLGYSEAGEGIVVGLNLALSDDDNGERYDARLMWRGDSTSNSADYYVGLRFKGTKPTLVPTSTLSPTPTPTPTITGTPPTPTPSLTPSNTPTPTCTFTPTIEPTATPVRELVSLQRDTGGYEGSTDTYILSYEAEMNFSDSQALIVRQGGITQSLVRFDLSGLPSPVTIKMATLYAYALERSNENPMMIGIYPLNRHWEAEEATWLMATADEGWLWSGASSVPWDREGESVSDVVMDQVYHWFPFDLTSLVQRWVDDPESNKGVILAGSGHVAVEYRLVANERRSVILRPRLVIDYIEGTPTPTPDYSATPSPTPTHTPTNTLMPTPTSLPISGEYTFQQGQDGYAGATDTQITAWDPDGNYATHGKMVVRQGGVTESLLRFDLSGLPSDAYIHKAVLGLYVLDRSNASSMEVQVYALSRPWVAEEATWLQASDLWLWHAPGAGGLGTDRESQPAAVVTMNQEKVRYQFDVTQAVQRWVEVPWANQGFLIRGSGGASVEYRLASSDWYDANLRPWLYVYYRRVTPTPGPSPTSYPATPAPPPKPTLVASPTLRATATASPTISPTPTLPVRPVGYQDGVERYDGTQDTNISSWTPEKNFGQDAQLVIRSGGVIGTLLRFNLDEADIEDGVLRAVLSLYVRDRSNENPMQIVIHEVQRDWEEDEATWRMATNEEAWARPGADAVPADHDAAPVAEKVFDSVRTWYHFDVTQAVRKWREEPWSNHGLLIKGYANVSVEYRITSSDGSQGALRPKLTVFYALEPAQYIGMGKYID
ncbi:MAG: DNRLRE domain-containing protein [Chloroflexota bacterium]